MGNYFDLTWDRIDSRVTADHVRHEAAGAVVVFEGVVRNHHKGRSVDRLTYEAYEPMAKKKLEEVGAEAIGQWPELTVAIVHRLGDLAIGEAATVVAVSSPHRGNAFDAARYIMDRIKIVVPIWKKEWFSDGTHEWVRPAPQSSP